MTNNEKKYTNDPAYKHIKNSSSEYVKKYINWKANLNPEEKEFYNSHPLPFLESKAENYSLFLKRYEKSKKESSVPIPLSQKMKTSFKKNLKNTCPECGSLVNHDEKFCGECGFNLENLVSKDNNTEVKKEQISKSEETNTSVSKENKKDEKPLKIKTKKTDLICSECGFPLNDREDVFCPECGCKIIYPVDEVDATNNIVENLDKEEKVDETDNIVKNLDIEERLDKQETVIYNEEKKEVPTSHNNLPIDILVDLKTFFEDKLINEDEYNHLRKSALKISKNSESIDGLDQIRSISREKLTELRSLFNERLIDQDEYDDLRKNLIEIE